MSDVNDSQTKAPDQVLSAPGEDDDSMDNTQVHPWEGDLTDLQDWCEDMGTKWPHLGGDLLPESHRKWAIELWSSDSASSSKGRVDFAAIPMVLDDIFSYGLSEHRTLALLKYFLGFVAELIMFDTVESDEEAAKIHDLLEESIVPAYNGRSSAHPTLGLTASPDSNVSEWEILEYIGIAIVKGLNERR